MYNSSLFGGAGILETGYDTSPIRLPVLEESYALVRNNAAKRYQGPLTFSMLQTRVPTTSCGKRLWAFRERAR